MNKTIPVMIGVALAWTAAGCGTLDPKPKDNLMVNVQTYHQHVRWARYHQASGFLVEGQRESFIGRYEELGEDFKVVDYDIKDVRPMADGNSAQAEVVMSWIREPDMRVRKDKIIETWKFVGGKWQIVERKIKPL